MFPKSLRLLPFVAVIDVTNFQVQGSNIHNFHRMPLIFNLTLSRSLIFIKFAVTTTNIVEKFLTMPSKARETAGCPPQY